MKVLLTGASGFVGRHLLAALVPNEVVLVGRSRVPDFQGTWFCSTIDNDTDFSECLEGVDIVVHCAGRAHITNEKNSAAIGIYRKINSEGTKNLAMQAAKAGVKRFIFLSTIKVLGEKTEPGSAFRCGDNFNPHDPYSISKVEAEVGLKVIGDACSMEIVIIRPPLVYGKGVKGNFASLLKLTRLPIPLPFGSIQNKRSLVSVENLVDLIFVCLTHPNAKNQTFLVSDDDDMSTSTLFSRLAEAGGYKAYIFRFPLILLSISLGVLGKSAIYDRLIGSMQVSIDYTKSQLGWKPPYKVNDSLRNCWLLDAERQEGFRK